MVKENRSKKLASRCIISALALIITMTCAADAYSSEPVTKAEITEAAQVSTTAEVDNDAKAEEKTTKATDETVAFKMVTFGASKGASTSSVVKSSVKTAASSSSQSAAATTTKSSTAAPQATTKAAATTKAYNYNYNYNYAPAAAPKATAATTAAAPAPAATTPASTAPASTSVPSMIAERTYETDATHPYNAQTNKITARWNAVSGASQYMLFVKGGQYANWTNVATTSYTYYTVAGLRRDTQYSFAVKSVDSKGNASALSAPVNIKTARMDYSAAGWQAMCRIVYHEVGGSAGALWDKPIVYVADCVANQYVCAKYTYQGTWPSYYRKYSSIESVIYTSTGFASDAVLASRGATYARVTERVKKAVWGAVYGITYYNGIANDYNIFFWNSSKTAVSNSKIAYSIKTPWNYVNIWRQYWG